MFSELAKIALLGTEHSQLSDQQLQQLQKLGLDTNKEQALVLAEAAALFAQVEKAGFLLEDFKAKMPEKAELTGEITCSLKSINHLKLILEGKFSEVFPEFLNHVLESSKCLPAEQVPALMQLPDLGEWWDLIELVLGDSGRWLVKQHPSWSRRLAAPVHRDWKTGNKNERLAILQQLRKVNPGDAIALIESTWEQDDHRTKAAFVSALRHGLSLADEPFLELALADSRKEVRTEAAALLSLVPLSNYAERMFERALECLYYEKGKWKVQIPEEPDKAALSDGILKIHPDWNGAKAGYIGQLFSIIPPSRWELHFEADPVGVIELFAKNEWAETIHLAITKAAILHVDEKWIGELASYWFHDEEAFIWTEMAGADLMRLAPPEVINRLAVETLNNTAGLPNEETLFFYLLQNNDSPWDKELTILLVRRMQDWLFKYKGSPWQVTSMKSYLKVIGLRSDPALLADLQKGWDTRSQIWYDWEKEVEEMLNTVLFRREMIMELRK